MQLTLSLALCVCVCVFRMVAYLLLCCFVVLVTM